MMPTFVIALREGLEASLIVGVVAAFLRQQDRRDALRWTWVGVVLAVILCTGVAVGLQLLDRGLPQREQEQLETVVAAAAVAMVSFMIVWMRRHAGGLSSMLRERAQTALASGSAWALVAMAFFAVLREGIETAVFLLAAFQVSGGALSAGGGALLGIVLAVLLGWAIYRGGVHLDLARFFRVTGVVLVLVAAGLVSSALHTAHEAGWLNDLQGQAVNLDWLVRPGSVASSLITGVFGLQARPTVGEALGWLVYAVPMVAYVLWPKRSRPRRRWAWGFASLFVVACLGVAAGVASAFAAAGETKPRSITISLSDEGCSPAAVQAPAGKLTFVVVNSGTARVTELELKDGKGVILGERENVVPGISDSFTLELEPGRYTLACPNGKSRAEASLVVTGARTNPVTAPSDPLLARAAAAYSAYVRRETDALLAGTERFVASLRRGDLAGAKALYAVVRRHYEAIEPVAESFGDLDAAIDARVNDVVSPDEWTGFHRVEQILWVKRTTAGAERYGAVLLADVRTLQRRVRTLRLQPTQLANGSVELLNEVANGKITGEEERYSHTDLSDFQGNLSGARKAFDLLSPALAKRGYRKLATTIAARFAAVQRRLDRYRRATPSGFASYAALSDSDRRLFAQEIDALAEPLSTVAAKVSR